MWPSISTAASKHMPPAAVTVNAMRAPRSRIGAVIPIGDQHERGEAGQLPEHHQLDQVARQHHAEHRAHEGQQEREEARHRVGRATCSSAHRPPPARRCTVTIMREHPGEAVEPQPEGQAILRQPVHRDLYDTPRDHVRVVTSPISSRRKSRPRPRATLPRCERWPAGAPRPGRRRTVGSVRGTASSGAMLHDSARCR